MIDCPLRSLSKHRPQPRDGPKMMERIPHSRLTQTMARKTLLISLMSRIGLDKLLEIHYFLGQYGAMPFSPVPHTRVG